MSYILDALRKSGQQRQLGQVPRLADAPAPMSIAPATSKKSTRFVAGVLVLAVLGLGVLIGGMRPWETPAPSTTSADTVEPQTTPAPAPVDEAAAAPGSEVPPQTATLPGLAPTMAPEAPAAPPAPPPMPVATTTPEVAPPTKAPPHSTPAPSPATKPAPPAIALTVHAYSDTPSERIARINGKFLHEGEEIEAGLKLERITKDGVVLNFRGQRLHRNIR